jgi:tetratricopeptide (TPR) repeat protein
MSELAAAQIPKPADEQAFERANEVLWRCILSDTGFKHYGRRGKVQYGVDLVGFEDNNPQRVVGVQCKLKSEHRTLSEAEVRNEVAKALKFRPLLSRYIIVTTAPDDPELGTLAITLTQEHSEGRAKPIFVEVMGWASLEREIRRHPDALNAFDPSHTPFAAQALLENRNQAELFGGKLDTVQVGVEAILSEMRSTRSDGGDRLDAEIDRYTELITTDPKTAHRLFVKLESQLDDSATGRIRFRITANIAASQLELGETEKAAAGFHAAFELDPENPKAIANKAAGFLLEGELDELKAFAATHLCDDPDRAALAGYLVQGLIQDHSTIDPLEGIPASLVDTKDVRLAMLRWHSERSTPEIFFAAASDAYHQYPEESQFGEYYATAILALIVGERGLLYGQKLSAEELSKCEEAKSILAGLWSEIRDPSRHVRGEPTATPLNLSLLYRLLGELDDAKTTMEEALVRFPGNSDVQVRAAAIFQEAGLPQRSFDLIRGLPINPVTASVRFSSAMDLRDWEEVSELATKHAALFPENERTPVAAAGLIAGVYLAPVEERAQKLNEGIEDFRADTRASVMLSRAAKKFGFNSLSDDFFEIASRAFEAEHSSFASRMTLAQEAFNRGEWSFTADLLDGYVDLQTDGEELRLLANSLCNEYPVRERSVRFFEAVSKALLDQPFYARAKGIHLSNQGKRDDAIKCFTRVFSQERDLGNFLLLVNAHLVKDHREKVRKLIEENSPLELKCTPLEKINCCHLLAAFGYYDGVIEHAYAALCMSPNHAQVVVRFCGLVINPKHNWLAGRTVKVGRGSWIKLKEKSGTEYEAIIDEKLDRPWGKNVESSNKFIVAVDARDADNKFTYETNFGVRECWQLLEIKPNWLQAFHYLSSNFERMFPEATGFGTVHLDKGDIQPALDMIKKSSELERERASLYFDKGLPLTFVSAGKTGGAISLAEYLPQIGERLRTCIGSKDERERAFALLEANGQNGVVIDALTAWRAVQIGILDLLVTRLGELRLPQSELDMLKQIIADREMDSDGDSMTMNYVDGQFYRDLKTAEDRAEANKWIDETIRKIEEKCSIVSVVFPDELPEDGDAIMAMPNAIGFAPAVLAGSDQLLLSEDMHLRQLAQAIFKTEGLWLQAVLMQAREESQISDEDYLNALVALAAHKHDFVSVSALDLAQSYKRDTSGKLIELRTLCQFVGSHDADPDSHLKLSASFINGIWQEANGRVVRHQKATSIVLESLILGPRADKWPLWAAYLIYLLDDNPRRYVETWLKGHFLPLAPVNAALRKVAEILEGRTSLDA